MGSEFLQPFFVFHSEAMFFIEDEEAQVLEQYILTQQSMGADCDVDLSIRKRPEAVLQVTSRDQPAEQSQFDWIAAETLRERLEML